ncbi:hypothetical protein ACH5RR_014432 [Cinchona calisaya]|uniref:Uncharacterized protein n=1 Tax=Cinchona calisaya TaxID=153742 RepID=A0ABD3A682_9GENT
MGEIHEDLFVCPSFSSYSSDGLAEVAARITDEFTQENLSVQDDEDDFEFSFLRDDRDPDVFFDGRIRPIFPIFNRQLLAANDGEFDKKTSSSDVIENKVRIPLKNLFITDREEREPPSSSSSEADDMESIPPGTYCVWRPKKVESSLSENWCKKKSNSTGSASKRWKFLDLIRRSNSEGKDKYVFLTPKHGEATKSDQKNQHPKTKQTSGEIVKVERKWKAKGVPPSAHEALYVRNRAIKQVDKKKSYLPYRQDLVGFFANASALSRTFPPF